MEPNQVNEYDFNNNNFRTIIKDGNIKVFRQIITNLNPNTTTLESLYPKIIQSFPQSFPILKFLIKNKSCRIDLQLEKGNTLLYEAVSRKSEKIVKFLIKSGANVNIKNELLNTPLHRAVQIKSLPIIRMLIDAGADIHAIENRGNNMLHLAAKTGEVDLIKYFVETHGIDINSRNAKLCTPLLTAVEKPFFNSVVYLVNKGANIELKNDKGCSALHQCCYHKNPKILEYLISKGANVNSRDIHNQTPLIASVLSKSIENIKLLLQNGAEINAFDANNMTALSIAANEGCSHEIIEYLLSYNPNLEIKSNSGGTAFLCSLFAIIYHPDLTFDIPKLLIQHGANIKCQDFNGYNCLHLCARIGNQNEFDFIDELISKGCDIESKDKYGNTVLNSSVYEGNLPYVEYFIRKGADIECFDSSGKTPLHTAVERGHFEIVKYLLSQNCNINCVDNYDRTPLFYSKSLEITEYLLSHGCDPSYQDKDGNLYTDIKPE